jgi:transmembrane sensor
MMATEPQSPITDALLGKFLAGETSATEAEQVRQWLTNPANQREYARFAQLWHAASRLNQPDTVNTEAAWLQVRAQMYGPAQAPPEAMVRPLSIPPKNRNWLIYSRVAAGIVLLLLAGLLGWQLWQRDANMHLYSGIGSSSTPLLSVSTTATTRQLTLPDGSQVWLNRNSRLTYPATFTDSSRQVTLVGEAFFDVTHNPIQPFRVRAGAIQVRVLGTSFNVRAIGDSVRVAVRSGRVQVSATHQAVVLLPNQEATYVAQADTFRPTIPLNTNRLAYQTGRLSFANASLAEVVQTLHEVYAVDISLENPALANCRLTADFGSEPVDAVLAVVAETLALTVRREGAVRILTGAGCGL